MLYFAARIQFGDVDIAMLGEVRGRCNDCCIGGHVLQVLLFAQLQELDGVLILFQLKSTGDAVSGIDEQHVRFRWDAKSGFSDGVEILVHLAQDYRVVVYHVASRNAAD